MKKYVILISFLIGSCVFHQKAELLDQPQYREDIAGFTETVLAPRIGQNGSASIGDLVLSYTEIQYSDEVAIAVAPMKLKVLPKKGWRKTHTYNMNDVYTNPSYYSGDIGAVLDDQDQVIMFVQTGGVKSGRRWRGSGMTFFGRLSVTVEDWRLRYNGRDKDSYKFEIVDTRDDKAIQATQSFVVSEKTFLEGFAVRGVLLKGLKEGAHGLINYQIVGNAN